MFCLLTLTGTGKSQVEIKIPFGKIFMETNHADKKNTVVQFLYLCICITEKKMKDFHPV